MAIIALLSDFGSRDWFAGEMKGAILRVAPKATIVDITHEIEPGAIADAAFTLLSCYQTFPKGTVFCSVVDPGVGSERAAIAVKTDAHFFTGPDNGILSWVLKKEKKHAVRLIESRDFTSPSTSRTFHGRDIFGPAAAHLAAGADFEKIGPLHPRIVELPWPAAIYDNERIVGSIIHIDRFGNAVTTIDSKTLSILARPPRGVLIVKSVHELPIRDFFQQAPPGQGIAYIGSTGYFEIAINGDSAEAIFDLHVGDKIEVL